MRVEEWKSTYSHARTPSLSHLRLLLSLPPTATRGAAKHIASLEALRLLLVSPIHPMPFDESLLVFPSRSGVNNPTFYPPFLPSPGLQAPNYRSMSSVPMLLGNPPSPPPRTPSTPYFPSFHSPFVRPSVSSSPSFRRHEARPQDLTIIGEEEIQVDMEQKGAQGGGWHWQQQPYQQQQYQQHQQQQLQQSTPLPSPYQDRGGMTLRGWGSTGRSTVFPSTPPPSPSTRSPALPLIPTAVLLEDKEKEEEGTPIQWPVGTKV